MRKSWWKILGVLLLLYAFIFGLLMPLKPGIFEVTPDSANAGSNTTFIIKGYNTHYSASAEKVRVWLKLDDQFALQAHEIRAIDDMNLSATFKIPQQMPGDADIQN